MAIYYRAMDPRGFDDAMYKRNWFLEIEADVPEVSFNPWPYLAGRPLDDVHELQVTIDKPGDPLDFTFGSYEVPLVTPQVAELLTAFAANDIQLIPAHLPDGQRLFVVVVVRLEDCLDRNRSIVQYYTRDHAVAIGRPDHEGKPNVVRHLIIDPAHTHERRLLRIRNWEGPLIVREDVKEAMERASVTGVLFSPVT